jgi:hypothetical protein
MCSLQDLTHLTARVLFGTYDNSNALFGVLAQLAVSLYLIQSVGGPARSCAPWCFMVLGVLVFLIVTPLPLLA